MNHIFVALLMFVAFLWVGWNMPTLVGLLTARLCKHNRYQLAEDILKTALSLATATDVLFANASALPRLYTPRLRLLEMLSLCYFKQGKIAKSFELDELKLRLLSESGNYAHMASQSKKIAVGYMLIGRLDEALVLSERCLPIIRSAYKNSTSDSAQDIEKLQTDVYRAQLAEALFGRAWILEELRRFREAEPLRQEALTLTESKCGSDAFEITPHLNRLGNLYINLGRFEEAEPLLLRCLKIRQTKKVDEELLSSAQATLSDLYCATGKLNEAEKYCSVAYASAVKLLSATNKTSFADFALSRATLWAAQGKHDDARELLEQSVADTETTYGRLNPRLLDALELLEDCLKKTNRQAESEKVSARVQEICTHWHIERKDTPACKTFS